MLNVSDPLALVYQANSYARRGPPESCIQIASRYPSAGFRTEVMLVRARVSVPSNITVTEALPRFLRTAPWKAVRDFGIKALNRQFIQKLRNSDPATTIVDIWPSWPSQVVPEAKRLGFTVVRTMTNCACATAKEILDEGYRRQGLTPSHEVSQALVDAETEELQQYDYIISSNDEVDQSLLAIGIPQSRILKSTFGWDSARFDDSVPEPKPSGRLRFLYVGTVGIGKGVPELLEAWRLAALPNAELLIIGQVEANYRGLFEGALPDGVEHRAFSPQVGGAYKSADVFVFPTLVEGGPQVVYEAAGCGVPVITTPMGAARLVEDGVNGLITPSGDPSALAAAMHRLAGDAELRVRMGKAAAESAKRFEYQLVGEERARILRDLLESRAPQKTVA